MRFSIAVFCYLSLFICAAQNYREGVVVDSETKEPIEFVNVYNGVDYTVSNSDGRYALRSSQDSIVFYRMGYEKLRTALSQLNDTIYLKENVFELNEVVVTNAKTIYQKIKDSASSNYLLTPHSEKFVLRTLLKRNDTILRIQDMQGKLRRKTSIYAGALDLEKKDFQVELTNMRKVGLVKDKEDIYFKFPSFYEIFSEFVRINAMGPDFEVLEKPFENGQKTRVEFNSPASEPLRNDRGYYIINNEDNAILSVHINYEPKYAPLKMTDKAQSRMKSYKMLVFFKEDSAVGKYYLSSARRDLLYEVVGGKDNPYNVIFEYNFILVTTDSFGDFKVKSNVNEHKDIFKLKHAYDKAYWNSQNQLLLTNKMKAFIDKLGKKNKGFKIRSNIKK